MCSVFNLKIVMYTVYLCHFFLFFNICVALKSDVLWQFTIHLVAGRPSSRVKTLSIRSFWNVKGKHRWGIRLQIIQISDIFIYSSQEKKRFHEHKNATATPLLSCSNTCDVVLQTMTMLCWTLQTQTHQEIAVVTSRVYSKHPQGNI